MLTFDPEKHHYFWNGKRVPGVNEIIKTVGLGRNYESVDSFYRDRGIATHKAIQLYLKGTLDESTLDPVIVPYFNQAKTCIDKNLKGTKYEAEVMKYSEFHEYAGTLDLVVSHIIYDWKCTKSVDPIAEIQGALYKNIISSQDGEYDFRVMQLDGTDGPVKEIHYDASIDLAEAVLTLYRKWKKK